MEEVSKLIPTPSVIRNILTLRYDPSQKPLLPQVTWKSFGTFETPSSDYIQKSIKDYLRKKIDDQNIKSVAIALSGGIDSTLILTLLKKTFPDLTIEAISIKFAESIDESEQAAKIADHFGVNQHVVFVENYLKELPKAISIIKLPFWDLHWYYVVKKAQQLSKFLASGDGGDELFGGYTFRYKKFLSLTRPESTPLEKVNAYLQCHERDRVPDQNTIFDKKAEFSWNAIYEILIPYFDNPLSLLDQVFLADYNGKLMYNFSPVNTAIHDYFKIESIAPILSEELISYAFHLPNHCKYDQNKNLGKLLLRDILNKHDMSSFMTEEKQGFNVNTLNLWKSHGKELCKYYLSDSRIVREGWINKNWIEQYIDRDDMDVRYVNKFLGLLAFEIWYRIFVTKEMKSDTTL